MATKRLWSTLPRTFSFKTPKPEPPLWQKDVQRLLPLQKQARASEAIQQFIYRSDEVTTKTHMVKVIYEAYSKPVFSAQNAFAKLRLGRYASGRFDQAQRDAVFPNANEF